jgi:hypothetical protein
LNEDALQRRMVAPVTAMNNMQNSLVKKGNSRAELGGFEGKLLLGDALTPPPKKKTTVFHDAEEGDDEADAGDDDPPLSTAKSEAKPKKDKGKDKEEQKLVTVKYKRKSYLVDSFTSLVVDAMTEGKLDDEQILEVLNLQKEAMVLDHLPTMDRDDLVLIFEALAHTANQPATGKQRMNREVLASKIKLFAYDIIATRAHVQMAF